MSMQSGTGTYDLPIRGLPLFLCTMAAVPQPKEKAVLMDLCSNYSYFVIVSCSPFPFVVSRVIVRIVWKYLTTKYEAKVKYCAFIHPFTFYAGANLSFGKGSPS